MTAKKLLNCLRYIDATGAEPELTRAELKDILKVPSSAVAEIKKDVLRLMGEGRGYLELVESDLLPLRQSETDARTRRQRLPRELQVAVDDWLAPPTLSFDPGSPLPPPPKPEPRPAPPPDSTTW